MIIQVEFTLARVKLELIQDDTGRRSDLPGLVTEKGVLRLLLSYLIELHNDGASFRSLDTSVRAVQRFLDFIAANESLYSDPKLLFQSFVKRSYEGTIGDNGIDNSGLYWCPSTSATTRRNLGTLRKVLEWIADQQDLNSPPTLCDTLPETFLHYAAWFMRHRYDFISKTKHRVRNGKREEFQAVRGGTRIPHTSSDPLEFPEKDFDNFFHNGIGKSIDFRSALRDKLIVLLMHGAGFRISEALGLWVHDVFHDPQDEECALVRSYHPEEGRAPDGWRGRGGETNRAAYLLQEFGLTPRNRLVGTLQLGWKGRRMDGADSFIQAHWFPKDYGRLFMELWKDYMRVLATFTRDHPYAFVAFRQQNFGNPLGIDSFYVRYRRGLRDIGKRHSSAQGYSPHGHRHAYGRRLMRSEIDPAIRQKCLHHSSAGSQEIYTQPSNADVSKALKKAFEPKTKR